MNGQNCQCLWTHGGFFKRGNPKSSLISIIYSNKPPYFWGFPIFRNHHIVGKTLVGLQEAVAIGRKLCIISWSRRLLPGSISALFLCSSWMVRHQQRVHVSCRFSHQPISGINRGITATELLLFVMPWSSQSTNIIQYRSLLTNVHHQPAATNINHH